MKSFLRRFVAYQNERFPFLVLSFTTSAVVFSSFTVVTGSFQFGKSVFISFITGLLYMFHVRLFDELKDSKHDLRYYPARPVSRGLISLREIKNLSILVITLEILINLFVSPGALLAFIIALLYSFLCFKEFFTSDWLRKHFFTYNLTHYLQTSLVVIYLYASAGVGFNLNKALLTHFVFTNLTLTLLEWARKMRTDSEENESRDTYSAQLGARGAALIFGAILLAAFASLYLIRIEITSKNLSMTYGWIALAGVVLSLVFYGVKKSKFGTNVLQLSSLIFFVLMHFLV